MTYYDIKKIEYKIGGHGSTMRSSYGGSLGFNRPKSEAEAYKMAMDWLKKQYPKDDVLDLKITYK